MQDPPPGQARPMQKKSAFLVMRALAVRAAVRATPFPSLRACTRETLASSPLSRLFLPALILTSRRRSPVPAIALFLRRRRSTRNFFPFSTRAGGRSLGSPVVSPLSLPIYPHPLRRPLHSSSFRPPSAARGEALVLPALLLLHPRVLSLTLLLFFHFADLSWC